MSSDMISIILTFTGLTGVYLFFRIEKLVNILLGDGQSVLMRQEEGRKDYYESEPLITERKYKRLRDAIFRKNIYGIEEGLLNVTIEEIKTKKKLNKTGYFYSVLPKFEETKKQLDLLKCFLLGIFFLSIFSIITFLFPDLKLKCIQLIIILLFSFVTIIALVFSIRFKTPHEKDKIKECERLRKDLREAVLKRLKKG